MSDTFLSITQALQLVALAPSIFVVTFLVVTSKRDGKNVVPILYFLSLASGFVLNLLPVFGSMEDMTGMRAGLLLASSSLPALSFLLVMQFLKGTTPPLKYWLILLVPILGGSPFIYTNMIANDVCFDNRYCLMTNDLRALYYGISGAVIFLFLMVIFLHSHRALATNEADYKHRYWIVISILLLNLVVLALDLASLNRSIDEQESLLLTTVVRIGFIYLVLTSMFRLFYDVLDTVVSATNIDKGVRNPEQDKRWVTELQGLLHHGLHREMNVTREMVGKKLGISEQQVSRIVNTYLGKNFNELINDKRIEEAKERLKTEDTQITVIAFDVGFSSIASFNRVFKESTGASPTAYRSFHKNSLG